MNSTRDDHILTIEEANAIAGGRAKVSADPVDATLWLVQGDGWTEAHEPMSRTTWEAFLTRQAGLGAGADKVVRDVLKDSVSPQTVAWVAKRLGIQLWAGFPRDKKVAEEVAWLVKRMEEAVGGHEAVDRLCGEIDH